MHSQDEQSTKTRAAQHGLVRIIGSVMLPEVLSINWAYKGRPKHFQDETSTIAPALAMTSRAFERMTKMMPRLRDSLQQESI